MIVEPRKVMVVRALLVGFLVLAMVVTGCGGDDDGEAATVELPAEALEVYEAYTEALRSGDGEAMLEHVTDDFTWLSYGTNLMDAEDRADYVTENYGSFEVDEIDERTVVGGDDEYVFSVPERATTPAVADGISLVKMEKIDDTWFLSAHRVLGEGEGSA